MKKILISLGILFATVGFTSPTFANNTIEVLPTMNTQSTAANRLWVGTFQIVWNEVVDNIVGKPIKFVGFNSPMAKELNKKAFKKSNISEKSYYTKYGVVSPQLKEEIEKGIKDKFNETSDILDQFNFAKQPDRLFVYAMLKKDFKFLKPFDKLSPSGFGKNTEEVEYFGIDENSSKKLYKNVDIMFYNSTNDFAVKLYTKDNDIVMLYRTDDEKTFDKYYADINKKSNKIFKPKKFNKDDKLRVPDFNLYQETSFKELEGHRIKGSNFQIDKTIETIDFKMNNEGVKLKSEAAIMMKCLALPMDEGRNFYFNDKFVLFLVEKGQKTPYYAMRVSDVKALNNTGRN